MPMMIYPTRHRGSSLLEVMIALLILAIGLLGFISLQTEGISIGRQAYMHSQSVFLAQDIVERMLANPSSASLYSLGFDETASASSDCQSSTCTSIEMANWDRAQWQTSVATALPAGAGAIAFTSAGGVDTVSINIRYQLARGRLNPGETAPTDEQKTYTYTLETQI